ncbi:hypothetical protein HDV06_006817 [Boothiomyces sp. JEL0866]|nr:hypothetical protein HDV06_006817 [Boothiomyces sp. JEL0866]
MKNEATYTLRVRQNPVQSSVSQSQDKLVELNIDSPPETESASVFQPILFAYASLVDKDSLEEIVYLADGSTKILMGSLSSSLYTLNDPEKELSFGKFFVFPDVTVRQEDLLAQLTPPLLSVSFSEQGVKMKLKRQSKYFWTYDRAAKMTENKSAEESEKAKKNKRIYSSKYDIADPKSPKTIQKAVNGKQYFAALQDARPSRGPPQNNYGAVALNVRQSALRGIEFPIGESEIELTHFKSDFNLCVLFGAAALVSKNTQEEFNYMENTNIRITYGLTTSGLHILQDPEDNSNFHAFLVFPNISVRIPGIFQLKIVLFKLESGESDVGMPTRAVQIGRVFTDPFEVIPKDSTTKLPPLLPSKLSRSFAEQGLKMKLRRQSRNNWIIENRRDFISESKRDPSMHKINKVLDGTESEGNEIERKHTKKRKRKNESFRSLNSVEHSGVTRADNIEETPCGTQDYTKKDPEVQTHQSRENPRESDCQQIPTDNFHVRPCAQAIYHPYPYYPPHGVPPWHPTTTAYQNHGYYPTYYPNGDYQAWYRDYYNYRK